MTRRTIGTSTTPDAVSGAHHDTDAIIAEFWTRDATGRADMIDATDAAARAAMVAGDNATALDLMGVSVALRSETVNPYTEANVVFTFMTIVGTMLDTMSPAAKAIIDRAGATVDQSIVDRVGMPHRVAADAAAHGSGQTYGAGRKPRRAVGPWVRAALATRPGAYMTDADIARWAMSTDPATGAINGAPFGLTVTETGLTGRIGAYRNGADVRDADDILVGHVGGVNAMMYTGA